MRVAASLCLWLATMGPAQATEPAWPALHDVTGVASNDVLNVRAAPDAGAPVIGTLPPDARDVEVIEVDPSFRWGRVNLGEASGWAARRYLQRHPGQWDGAFPQLAACFGTEPFWTLRIAGDRLDWIAPGTRAAGTVTARLGSTGRRDRHGLTGMVGAAPLTAIVTTERCGDGMSDSAYGLAIDAVLEGDVLTGCCTIAPSM